jgi:hypothetical protein
MAYPKLKGSPNTKFMKLLDTEKFSNYLIKEGIMEKIKEEMKAAGITEAFLAEHLRNSIVSDNPTLKKWGIEFAHSLMKEKNIAATQYQSVSPEEVNKRMEDKMKIVNN